MTDLERITTEYSPAEDRIRIVGKTAEDTTATLWITLRLLQLLLPHLIDWLKKRTALSTVSGKEGDGASLLSQDSALSEIMQGFAQQAAIIAMGKQDPTPVRATDRNKDELVCTVDIMRGDIGVKIVFKIGNGDDEGRQYFLTVGHELLRQWLYILYNQSQIGEWSIGLWPEWITAKAGEESNVPVSRH